MSATRYYCEACKQNLGNHEHMVEHAKASPVDHHITKRWKRNVSDVTSLD